MKKLSPFFILLAGILWGCMGIFVRGLNKHGLYSLEIVWIRSFLTCLFMGITIGFYQYKLFLIRMKDLWVFMGSGLCSIVFFNYCYFKAMTVTSLSIAAVLLYTAPAFVMVLSFFLFREAFHIKKVIALIMTFLGCVLVTGVLDQSAGQASIKGILLGLGAGFGYALYSIFGRYAINKGYHTLTITFYTFLLAALGSFFMADTGQIAEILIQRKEALFLSVGMGLIVTVLPYLTYTLGLLHVENSKASIIASIEPVMATFIGMITFHEKITLTGILGMVLVIAALIICNVSFPPKK